MIILTKFSSLEVGILTTFSAINDRYFVKMTFPFRWIALATMPLPNIIIPIHVTWIYRSRVLFRACRVHGGEVCQLGTHYRMAGLTHAPAIPQPASAIPNATATTNTQVPWVTYFLMFWCEARRTIENQNKIWLIYDRSRRLYRESYKAIWHSVYKRRSHINSEISIEVFVYAICWYCFTMRSIANMIRKFGRST